MKTTGRDDVLVPRETFIVWDEGRMLRFRRNRTTIRVGHRLLEGREHRFRPFKVDFDVDLTPEVVSNGTGGLQAFTALRSRAKALGVTARGNTAELEAAIAAAEKRQAGLAKEGGSTPGNDPEASATGEPGTPPAEQTDQTDQI